MVIIADEKTDLQRGVTHIGAGVCMVVHDGAGNILLMKRGPKARDERGKWDICGGAIEFGETILEAVIREVDEELCTKPLEVEFLLGYDAHRIINNNQTHWIQLLHYVKVNRDKVQVGEPHKIAEIGWFTAENLPEPRHSQFHKTWNELTRRGLV